MAEPNDSQCAYCRGTGQKGRAPDTYDCPDCSGKGWLTTAEREAIERRYGRASNPHIDGSEKNNG